MRHLVAQVLGYFCDEPVVVLFFSADLILLRLRSGWMIVVRAICGPEEWDAMTALLPDDVTYDPGASDFVDDTEFIFIPAPVEVAEQVG